MPLKDLTLPIILKVQVQITSCPMTHEAYAVNLHIQFAYNFQTHSIKHAYPRENEDSLYITINPNQDPICYFVPK